MTQVDTPQSENKQAPQRRQPVEFSDRVRRLAEGLLYFVRENRKWIPILLMLLFLGAAAIYSSMDIKYMAIAVGVGLLAGVMVSSFIEARNDTVRYSWHIRNRLGERFLGAVPIISPKHGDFEKKATIVSMSPNQPATQDYRLILETTLAKMGHSRKTMLVASASPGEGKTTTLTNLGISAALKGLRVLIVDSDLYKPDAGKIFNVDKDRIGLANYLDGTARLDDIVHKTQIPNLSAIAGGKSPVNPYALISSYRMKEFATLVKAKFDLILFDSPPCTVVTDTLVLAKLVDAVINVTKVGRYSRERIMRGINLLEQFHGKILGVILNGATGRERRQHSSYFFYGHEIMGDESRDSYEEVEAELARAKANLDISEKKLAQRQEDNSILFPEDHDLILKELSRLKEAAAAASVERFTKEVRYNYVKGLSIEEIRHIDEVLNSKVIKALKVNELKAMQNVQSLESIFGEEDPKTIPARSELTTIRTEIDRETVAIVEQLRQSYEQAKQQHEGLTAAVKKKRQEMVKLLPKAKEYEVLRSQVEANRETYREILNRIRRGPRFG